MGSDNFDSHDFQSDRLRSHPSFNVFLKDRSTVQMSQTLALPFYGCVGACVKYGKSNDLLRDGVILYTVLVSFSATPVRHV